MDRDSAKKLLPIIKAYSEGKTIQMFDGSVWIDMDKSYIAFNGPAKDYRIKPEPKLRPYNEEEMRGLVGKSINYRHEKDRYLVLNYIDSYKHIEVFYQGKNYTYKAKDLLDNEWHVDGKLCGVEE